MPRKSLREMLPSNGSEFAAKIKKVKKTATDEDDTPPLPPPPRPRRQKRKRWLGLKLIWVLIVLVVIIAAGFFISKILSTASVEIIAKQFEIALNGSAFTVPYESVTIPTIKDDRVVAAKLGTGTPKKAGGAIIISNNYSNQSQPLVVTTRFETTGGKIYRLTKAVIVPGTKVVEGKTVAGSVEANVIADQTGPAYNTGLTTFKIPGFKGDPRYDKISARSQTAMTGGTAGQEWVISEAERTKAVADLKQSLLKEVAEQIRFQIPENFVLYDNNIIPTFKEEVTPISATSSGQATLTFKVEARAIIFDREVLSRILVASSWPEGANQPFIITNLDQLAITLDQNSLKSDDKKVTVTATGQAKVKLTIDLDILRSKLIGVSALKAQEIFTQFPAILKSQVSFQPPWIRQFPKTVERIKIVIP
jgi:hypothetical protein